MEITESELAEWKRLAEEATPGEWVSTNDAVEWTPKQKSPWNDRGASVSVLDPRTDIVVIVGGVQDEQGGAVGVLRNTDAAFITASRTAVPRLIAEVRRLKHAAKSWEKEADINNDVAQRQQNRAERAEAENAMLREWLDTIRGIAYHHDGYETADNLKALIDELYEDAGKALAGESVKYIDLNSEQP